MTTRTANMSVAAILISLAGLVGYAIACQTIARQDSEIPLETSLAAYQPGNVDGDYGKLLRSLYIPDDKTTYKKFCDWGYWSGTSYAGYTELSKGYWVYRYPRWYIYEVDGPRPKPVVVKTNPAWGPIQATGEPDTAGAGDIQTAWASSTSDGQDEWLELSYSTNVQPLAVLVYETYNPGAVYKVTVFNNQGSELTVWSGADPTGTDKDRGTSVIPFQTELPVNRIRIYIKSTKVAGWNEIDAVGLLDTKGTTHWATHATASSHWGQERPAPPVRPKPGT